MLKSTKMTTPYLEGLHALKHFERSMEVSKSHNTHTLKLFTTIVN